jgi:hypothetical protein
VYNKFVVRNNKINNYIQDKLKKTNGSKADVKSKAVLLLAMEAHGGRGGIAPTHT